MPEAGAPESGGVLEPTAQMWPAVLRHGRVTLRPIRLSDYGAWREVRLRNERWLGPWEPTATQSWTARHRLRSFLRLRSQLRYAARTDRMVPFILDIDGQLAGQVNLGPMLRGVLRSADIGYWIDQRYAGQGLVPIGVALAVRHAFSECGLHRVHAAVRPENEASLRVMAKLGFREEARYQRYLDIDGDWRDHIGFALTTDDDLSAIDATLT